MHCLIARAGVYGTASHRLEAVRLEGFTGKDDAGSWVGQARSYGQAYTAPVVVGQVISPVGPGAPGEIGAWSQFWARGPTSFDPPTAASLFVGRHTGEDPGARGPETLAYLVFETGTGTASGQRYEAGLSAEFVRGVEDAPPYDHALSGWLTRVDAAALASAGMDGIEGGWPILYGAGAATPGALSTAIEEDWYFDPERSHTTEQVAWVAVGRRPSACGVGFEVGLVLPWVLGRALRRRRPEERRCPTSSLDPRRTRR